MDGQPAIRLKNLTRDYGDRRALSEVDLSLPAGGSLAVLGPNGSGKSTLLRILATLLRPSRGEVEVLGSRIPREAWKVRGRIGYLGHDPLLYRDLSGRENLRFHARLHGIPPEEAERRIRSDLEKVEMDRRADDRIDELSAGMKQRIAVCRAVLHRPDLLLLDEPDSNLDPEGREIARRLLGPGGDPERPRTVVTVSHEPERARAEADHVLVLGPGGVVVSEEAAA